MTMNPSHPSPELAALYEENRTRLLESQSEWTRRLEAIGRDRKRVRGALDPDFAEQAVQRENDPTLDALDERGRSALRAIRAALSRIESGNYGWCVACGSPIADAPARRARSRPLHRLLPLSGARPRGRRRRSSPP
ncbi:MAG: TraR/DksA family transcriptional regulator [Deltaproteobacteria bacterium]|nr:TraR/DksA family transcriptional regulator [Deltaproteobacteria bacterium]